MTWPWCASMSPSLLSSGCGCHHCAAAGGCPAWRMQLVCSRPDGATLCVGLLQVVDGQVVPTTAVSSTDASDATRTWPVSGRYHTSASCMTPSWQSGAAQPAARLSFLQALGRQGAAGAAASTLNSCSGFHGESGSRGASRVARGIASMYLWKGECRMGRPSDSWALTRGPGVWGQLSLAPPWPERHQSRRAALERGLHQLGVLPGSAWRTSDVASTSELAGLLQA